MSIDSVAKHPVPSRLIDGPEVPYIGPHYEAYQKAHAETVGPAADKWWAKVRGWCGDYCDILIDVSIRRWQGRPFTGIVLSTPFALGALRTVILPGSRRVT